MMEGMNHWLSSMAGSGKVMLGAILGGMTAFDMGGPVNKVATLFAQTQVSTQPWLMGGVGIAICVPPLGMALATFMSPKRYKKEERESGKAAAIMGMIGISEGAIPFAAADPMRVIPAIVAGGIVGNITGFMMHSINHAPGVAGLSCRLLKARWATSGYHPRRPDHRHHRQPAEEAGERRR